MIEIQDTKKREALHCRSLHVLRLLELPYKSKRATQKPHACMYNNSSNAGVCRWRMGTPMATQVFEGMYITHLWGIHVALSLTCIMKFFQDFRTSKPKRSKRL